MMRLQCDLKIFLLLQRPHLSLDPLVVLVQLLLLSLVRSEGQAALLVVGDVQLLADVVHHLRDRLPVVHQQGVQGQVLCENSQKPLGLSVLQSVLEDRLQI